MGILRILYFPHVSTCMRGVALIVPLLDGSPSTYSPEIIPRKCMLFRIGKHVRTMQAKLSNQFKIIENYELFLFAP